MGVARREGSHRILLIFTTGADELFGKSSHFSSFRRLVNKHLWANLATIDLIPHRLQDFGAISGYMTSPFPSQDSL